MTNVRWTSEVDARRVSLLKDGYSYNAVAAILSDEFNGNFSMHSVQNRSRVTNTTKNELQIEVLDKVIKSPKNKDTKMFPEEAYQVDEELSFTPEKKRRLKEIWESFNDGKAKKILSLSDLHAPYMDFKAIETAILEHSDADILVLNGDVFDGHAMSDFDKLDDFDIEIEFEQVFLLLDVVTPLFEKIIWVSGNHEMARFIRMISRKFGNGMKKYVLKRLNPIQYISEKYDNLIVVPHNHTQIGTAVFVHPNGYSGALMSTALKQAEIFENNKYDILPYPEVQAVIQGHTHDLGSYYQNGIKVIEQGHLTFPPDYVFDAPRKRRWQKGYAVVHLDKDGNVEFNKSREYHLD